MNKFITLLLLLIGAHCFGTVMPFPEREISVEIVPVQVVNAYDYPRQLVPSPGVADQYSDLLRAGTDRLSASGPLVRTVFNRLPFIWHRDTMSSRLSPKTESDLNDLFNGMPVGQFERPLRTLRVLFVPSLPEQSALTSGKYRAGKVGSVSWAQKAVEDTTDSRVAFAFGGSDPQAHTTDFAEAFRQAFMVRHGVEPMPAQLDADRTASLRASLLSTNGLGCFEPVTLKACTEFSNKISANKQWLFVLSYDQHIPERCYRLESSTDLVTWTEVWFSTVNNGLPKDFYKPMAGNAKMFYRYGLCKEK